MAAVAVPFLLVQFPPITDLPQHTAQIRLLGEALRSPGAPYAVQWLTPYGLSYTLLGALWLLAGPVLAGRLAFLALALLWVAAVHALAAWRDRPASHAVLASVLVFQAALYWGFFNFLFGWPLFVLWFLANDAQDPPTRGRTLCWGVLSALLYFGHALWFAFAMVVQTLEGWRTRQPWRTQFLRLAAVAPVLALAAWWFHSIQGRGFESGTVWDITPWQRLGPAALVNGFLGGLRGRGEAVVLLVLGAWSAAALLGARRELRRSVDARRELRRSVDARLLVVAALGFVLYVLLPYKFQNTIRFGDRWLPVAAVAFLLALPAPRWSPKLQHALAIVLLVGFSALTSAYWMAFDSVEMSGMEEALQALPEAPRVIGLDYVFNSKLIENHPFLQAYAYAQVRRGGSINFSFADFAPSLVVYRPPREMPWTLGLEWVPLRVRRSDFQYFDFALVHGEEAVHRHFAEGVGLVPMTTTGLWRLYRIPHPLPPGTGSAPLFASQ